MANDCFVTALHLCIKCIVHVCFKLQGDDWEWPLQSRLIICLCFFLPELSFIKTFCVLSWQLKNHILISVSTTTSVAPEIPSLQHPIQSWNIFPLPVFSHLYPALCCPPEFQVHCFLSSSQYNMWHYTFSSVLFSFFCLNSKSQEAWYSIFQLYNPQSFSQLCPWSRLYASPSSS